MTPEHLAELQAAWPANWQFESYSPQTRWMRLRDDTFVAHAGTNYEGEWRSLGSGQGGWHATGETFAECLVQLKRQMRASSRGLRRRAEDIDHLLEDMP